MSRTPIDLNDPLAINQIFPDYSQLREQAPIHRLTMPDGNEIWLASSYALCTVVATDRRFVHDPATLTGERAAHESLGLGSDPPEHTRLRRLAQPAFAPKLLNALRDRLQHTVDGLIDQALPNGHMEVLNDFAFPMTTDVISDFLGFPVEDRGQIAEWTAALVATAVYEVQPGLADDADSAFTDYLHRLIEVKRRAPTNDVIGALVQVEAESDRLNEAELTELAKALIAGGFETTILLLTQGLYALLTHPDQLKLLQARPELIKSAVEEMLRFAAGGAAPTRFASEDIELGGVVIPRGAVVMPLYGAANFDPARFTDPLKFDITRTDNKHLSFGHGLHYCLGAPLARIEAEIAFATLARRLPNLRLADHPQAAVWADEFPFMRTLRKLDVTF